MARLRLNGLRGTAVANPMTLALNGTAATWASDPGFPLIVAPDYYSITVEPNGGGLEEIVALTAHAAGATTGTVTRLFETVTGGAATQIAHTAVAWDHCPTKLDFDMMALNVENVEAASVSGGSSNLLSAVDASFESGAIGTWVTNFSSSTLANNAANGHAGTHSMAVTPVVNGSDMYAQTGLYAVSANTSYTSSGWSKSASTARSFSINMQWYTAASAFISNSVNATTADSSASWTQSSLTATSPANAAFVLVYAYWAVPSEVHYLDDLSLTGPGGSFTIPDVGVDTQHLLTLTGSPTFLFPAAVAGKSFTLGLKQDATGSRTVTWPGTVLWPGGTAPTLTTTAAKTDVFAFDCLDGTNWLGFISGQNF